MQPARLILLLLLAVAVIAYVDYFKITITTIIYLSVVRALNIDSISAQTSKRECYRNEN